MTGWAFICAWLLANCLIEALCLWCVRSYRGLLHPAKTIFWKCLKWNPMPEYASFLDNGLHCSWALGHLRYSTIIVITCEDGQIWTLLYSLMSTLNSVFDTSLRFPQAELSGVMHSACNLPFWRMVFTLRSLHLLYFVRCWNCFFFLCTSNFNETLR